MVTLHLLGLQGPFPPFSPQVVRMVDASNPLQLSFITDLLALAKIKNDRQVARILRRKVRKYYSIRGLIYFDRLFLMGSLGKIRQLIAPREPDALIGVDPPWPVV